jgi:pimeloyl-ACP methyl ester carboxylesterase
MSKVAGAKAVGTVNWTELEHEVAGTRLQVRRAGKGAPLVVLHHDFGMPAKSAFLDGLAAKYDVIVPNHPGWGSSQRPEWMRSVRDIAAMYRMLLLGLGVEKASLAGLGFGGWIAAEMLTYASNDIGSVVLVGSMGVKPSEGYILDQAIVSYIDYARAAFHDDKAFATVYGAEPSTDQLEAWDIAREMCFRIAWKPYMYSQTLPHLLKSVKTPALLVWGSEDKIVPMSAAQGFKAALPNAKLEIVKSCGHAVALEKPAELLKIVNSFIK